MSEVGRREGKTRRCLLSKVWPGESRGFLFSRIDSLLVALQTRARAKRLFCSGVVVV